ncbi:Protein sfk1 [Cytospora mali]|uniref:Protein sfk1 n=1 Tax=Cytospora mali TaxID=578113 RepID=A0A194W4Z9_CYTMA|nr:Protein sfk1 [Valsa mali]
MLRLSYWVFPIAAGLVWLGMLLGMLLHWIVDTKFKVYPSETDGQTIAYISDVGAGELKPLFITGCVLTTILLDTSFLSDRWLRHRGRLVPNSTMGEKVLSGLTISWAVVGTAGLILLSIFDTYHHPRLHDVFLGLFIVGYLVSAVFICWEYQRLGIRHREHRILRVSFWIKLAFVLVTVVLAVPFVILTKLGRHNPAAILEWVIALVFSFYVFSFYVDLYPAVSTKNGGNYHTRSWERRRRHHHRGLEPVKMEEGSSSHSYVRDTNANGLPSNF